VISSSLCLADAQVFIDGARYGFLQPFLATHTIGVASTAYVEVKFYRDDRGVAHEIDLQPFVTSGQLSVVSATGTDLQELYSRGVSSRLGHGERESLALVLARGVSFCTADGLAIKAMRDLGVYDRWVPLEDMLVAMDPPWPVPDAKYRRAHFEQN
jgi:hypothetical protein